MEWLVSLYRVLEMIREYNIHLQIGLPIKQLALWQYIYFKGVLFYPTEKCPLLLTFEFFNTYT